MDKKTKKIKIGNIVIGGGNPIAVQSMTKTDTSDVKATIAEIHKLEAAGCQIIRCAVPDEKAAHAIGEIKKNISIPLIADIHFNYKLAIISAENGADKLRINPGNIGDIEKIKSVVSAAKERNIPIRVGVNSGSLQKDIKKKYFHPTAKALVESALQNVKILEKLKFTNIVIAVKSTSVPITIEAYELLSKKVDYPLHVGLTESGISKIGIIKSSVGIGSILSRGIGDTIRVSLTRDPIEEVRVGFEILKSLERIKHGIVLISCPTCGRTDIDVEKISKEIEEKTRHITAPLKVAIMGCEVNGPGEAMDADLGLAGGREVGLIFKHGEILKKVNESEMVKILLQEIESMAKEYQGGL
ncbi:flavodoxin-dependent (E)-4-hydroxy-3-methylbut-2-enyl-diphosphate synthase [Candidatus Saganbacteria bacterium]|nr:flavodoxin-dependent (E)-4-hydroxy-3-methylbut-2-enyl-diphosphate synthase [Candidatus Saganbacteria bacterium]